MEKIDKSKFPLIGIAKYLEEATKDVDKGRRMAKNLLYRTLETSRTATEKDKVEAKVELDRLEDKMRESSIKKLDKVIVMKNPNDLRILDDIEEIYISEVDYNRVRDSIIVQGVIIPLIITEDNRIVDGRNRWKIAKELGLLEVPTIFSTEDRLDELIRLMLCSNLCRRQMTKEERIHYIKLLKELGKSKKGPGRPSLKGEKKIADKPPSNREIAEIIRVSPDTIDRAVRKEKSARFQANKKIWGQEEKKFFITIGKPFNQDEERFLTNVHEYIDAIYKLIDPKRGDKIEFVIISRSCKNEDVV